MSHRLLVFCLLILGSLPHSSLSARPICNTFKYQKQTVTSCRGQGLFKFIRIPDNLGTATEHLLFDNNRIRVLKNASFVRYPKLSFISLRTNRLESIDLFAFSKLAKLRKLDFRENDLRLPSSWSSLALPATLETLDLSENPLGQLPDNHFAHLTRLKTFRAAEANLEVLHPDALAGLTSLRVLDLVNNRLMTLPEANTRRHLDAMPSLSGLRLGGANPWHCDCRLAWLKRWLQTHPFVSTLAVVRAPNEILELSPVCAAPRRLEGRELFSQRLPNTALRCRTPTSRSWVLDVFNSPDVPMYAAIAGGWLLALLAVCTAVTVCILPEEKFATPEAPAPSKAAVLKVPKPKMGTQSLSGAPLAKEPQIQLNHLPRATPNSPTQSREQRTPQYQLLSAQSPKIRQNVQPTGNQNTTPRPLQPKSQARQTPIPLPSAEQPLAAPSAPPADLRLHVRKMHDVRRQIREQQLKNRQLQEQIQHHQEILGSQQLNEEAEEEAKEEEKSQRSMDRYPKRPSGYVAGNNQN